MRKEIKRDDYPIRVIWNSVIAGIVYERVSLVMLAINALASGYLKEKCKGQAKIDIEGHY